MYQLFDGKKQFQSFEYMEREYGITRLRYNSFKNYITTEKEDLLPEHRKI